MGKKNRLTAKNFPPIAVAAFKKQLLAYYQSHRALGAQFKNLPAFLTNPENLRPLAIEERQMSLAQLFWVSADITAESMDAASDVPVINPQDAPAESGILFFEKPLPPLPLHSTFKRLLALKQALAAGSPLQKAQGQDQLEVDGICWYSTATGIELAGFALNAGRERLVPGVLSDPRNLLVAYTLPSGKVLDIDSLADNPAHQSFLALVSALWVMMKTPTVAEVSDADIATGYRYRRQAGEAPGQAVPARRLVQVVDMRPLAHKDDGVEDAPGSGSRHRRSAHRWVVRGHWRNQAVGTGREQRRLTWIPSYIKGNPEGELIVSEKVLRWRNQPAGKEKNEQL